MSTESAASLLIDHKVIDIKTSDSSIRTQKLRALTRNRMTNQSLYSREEEDDDDDDDSREEETREEEHTYPHGRLAIPMKSPNDDDIINEQLILNEDETEETEDFTRRMATVGVQRLRRLRDHRGFFQSDDDLRSFRYQSNGGILQRITFRRRKREEKDVFWMAIGVLTLLSFIFMCYIIIYLTQTDFFESHQNDLFGTTVDNRFTVVAQNDAEIFLKNCYSNSYFSEGMVAFNDGILKIGRRSLLSSETQRFYGVSFFFNGTASFTNRLESPVVEADYLNARKGVMFDDGTMMTTAAGHSSGGAKEQGDLNLVSNTGSVVTSAGGNPLLFVDPAGTVTVANTKSDEPTTSGITLDGTLGQISIGAGLMIKHDNNSSILSTPQALYLESSSIFVGTSAGGKIRISVPAVRSSGNDDGARALQVANDVEESDSVTLEVAGQTSVTQKEGGDIHIVGGDGLNTGGDVTLVGGQATESGSEYGSVTINAGLHQTDSSFTTIGSHGLAHKVSIHGLVSFNHISSKNDTTQVKVGGGQFNVSSRRITLDNQAASSSQLHVNSNDIHLGSSSPSIQVGKAGLSTITMQSASTTFDATESVALGESASSIIIGSNERPGQNVKVKSSTIQLDVAHRLNINTVHREAITTISGMVYFNGSSSISSLLSITNDTMKANPARFRVGATGKTSIASIEATHITMGGYGANATVLSPRESKLNFFSSSITIGSTASEVLVKGKSVIVDSTDTLTVGDEANEITVGSENVNNVNILSEAVSVAGATTIKGASLAIQSSKVNIGGKLTSDIAIGAAEAMIDVGSQAKFVFIGVGSPTVNIGSDTSVINLSGKVKMNGKLLDSRRLDEWSEPESEPFGYLNADRVAVSITQTEALTSFALHWDSGYSSKPDLYLVNSNQEHMLSVAASVVERDSKVDSRHLQILLHASSIVLVVQNDNAAAQTSKIRCRVHHHTAQLVETTAMEVSAVIEHCSGITCENGIFLGLHGQRIIRYNPGDSFSTHCTVASTALGELFLHNIQLSFTKQ